MESLYLAALQMVPGIGNARIRALVAHFGSASQAWQAGKDDLLLSKRLDEATCNQLCKCRGTLDIQQLSNQWEKAGIKVCTIYDPEYPSLLLHTFNPPAVLYYRGRLPEHERLMAIVGSRRSSVYGRNAAYKFAAELAAMGFWVVSGAARGIDTAAHKGALSAGMTAAVLGCGVDVSYPPENAGLFSKIADQGCIISEYAPGVTPHPGHFPARNRIISGLSKGVIVIEAGEKSGALITADFALEEGRDVFAVPGSIFADSSKGTHRLIKQGAKLTECLQDIVEEYGLAGQSQAEELAPLTAEEAVLFQALDCCQPLCLEELVMKTKLSLPTVTYILLQLELRGLAAEQSGQRYVRSSVREGIG